jgi:hypothetical protein
MTQNIPASLAFRAEASREDREFDLFDSKGRRFGYRVTITKVADENSKWSVRPEMVGVRFTVEPQSMRGGYRFGAVPVNARKVFNTYAEAVAAKELMFAKAAKAAAKKAGA